MSSRAMALALRTVTMVAAPRSGVHLTEARCAHLSKPDQNDSAEDGAAATRLAYVG